ncbi:MAG: hypothetical protein K0Q43_215 [Ramlibacter sp.]|nr:hypothetical protein [Ramlibacter sp.]
MTEWVGRCAAGVVSLCWDWAQGADGNLYLLKEVAPRTNLMVIDATGYDRPGDLALPDLWTLIEGIPWPAAVAEAVASIPPFPPSARTNH